MSDSNIFAILTPCDHKNNASSAFKLEENARWFCEANGGVAQVPIIGSREATPANDSLPEDDEAGEVDRLVITFDELLKTNLVNGLQFGTSTKSSHILLGHRGTAGISGRQYNITVDNDLRIWLNDFHSSYGTAVGHSGQNQKEVKKRETWILAYEPGIRNRFGEITINTSGLIIRIEFPNHAAAEARYLENLRKFVKKCNADTEGNKDLLGNVQELGLDSAESTQAPSQARTPRERLVYYKDKILGRGSFGEVHRVIRIRDGRLFAAKTFTPPDNKNKRRLDAEPEWLTQIRREFTIMRDNPHHNIMQVFEFREIPEPVIIMPYYPDGSILTAGDSGVLDEDKYVTAFGQILDGLHHLHAKGVVHRDLKPANFLVESRPLFKVVISDFGLAKVMEPTSFLTTFCGSAKYAAPEVFPGVSHRQGPLVDIWSLGVIGLEWIYRIPEPATVPTPKRKDTHVPQQVWYEWIVEWSSRILRILEDQDTDTMIAILNGMIRFDPSHRFSAEKCLLQGFRNNLFKRRVADGLIASVSVADNLPWSDNLGGGKATMANAASSPKDSPKDVESEETIILGNLWDGPVADPSASSIYSI